ncbi:MAG: biotin transporter BioY [Calditrichaeota bacterium]|nr:biotin transporter BioY [Calditrichota bacterium]
MVVQTYADVFRPAERTQARVYNLALVIGGSLFIALMSQLAIRLPFTPVPVTGQTFAVLLIGMLYGSRMGAATVLAYLTEGLMGLPVFANGAAGLAYALGPTGGYLIGFVPAAYIAGFLAEKGWHRRIDTTLLALVIADVFIFLFGVAYLATFSGVESAIHLGLLPFIPGNLLKIALVAFLLPTGWKILHRQKS